MDAEFVQETLTAGSNGGGFSAPKPVYSLKCVVLAVPNGRAVGFVYEPNQII